MKSMKSIIVEEIDSVLMLGFGTFNVIVVDDDENVYEICLNPEDALYLGEQINEAKSLNLL